jgi:hypothetical protein
MSGIDTLLLTNLLGTGLQDRGITDDIMQSESVSTILAQLADEFNKATNKIITQQNQLQQEASQAVKIGGALTDALKDKLGPTSVPQQDMNAPQDQPAPDAGMTPPADPGMTPPADPGMMSPPEMNVPPAPMDMGAQPPMPDAGVSSQPGPDMMQFDPGMIGAVQPRF